MAIIPESSLGGSATTPGKSAYDIAVSKGYKGTEQEWLNSLKGQDGKSAYQLAQDKGYTGTLDEWLASLHGKDGQNAKLTIGKVTTVTSDKPASAEITGEAPEQALNLSIPTGKSGKDAEQIKLAIGSVTTLAAGSKAAAEITGAYPNLTLNLSIPSGKPGTNAQQPTFSMGTVTTLSAGSPATAEITGSGTAFTINLGIPKGDAAPSTTSLQTEVVESKVVTAGQKVAIKFAKKYTAPPIVLPNSIWNGQQMVEGQASEITTTGCNVTVMQSRGTLLLSGGPFENAAAGATFRMFVIGN